jgi:hypothetical protein
VKLSFGNILGTEMEVPDMYTCQELCRYTCEVKLWEHSGNRDGGSRYVHLPGAVSGTQVRLSFGNILETEMEVPDMYSCQELCQVLT